MKHEAKVVRDAILEHNEKVRLDESAKALLNKMPNLKELLDGKRVSDFEGLILDKFEDLQILAESNEIKINTRIILDYDIKLLNIFGSASGVFRHRLFGVYIPLLCILYIIYSAFSTKEWLILLGLSSFLMASFFSSKHNALGPLALISSFICAAYIAISDFELIGWLSWPLSYILMHLGFIAFRNNYRSSLVRAAKISEVSFLMLLELGIIRVLWFPKNEDVFYELKIGDSPLEYSSDVRKAIESNL